MSEQQVSGRGVGTWLSLRHQGLVWLSVGWLGAMVLFALFGPMVFHEAATEHAMRDRLLPPFSFEHGLVGVLGTDALGRSMLARLVVGTQLTLVVVLGAVLMAAIIGFVIGLASAYFGGWVDIAIMRIVDIMMTIPTLLLALAILFLFQGSTTMLIGVLTFTSVPIMIRTTRAQGLEVRERVYVEAARSMGAGRLDIMFRQMASVIAPTVVTVSLLEVAVTMIEVAALSYLGVGLQPPAVAWGIMVADGEPYLTAAWWLALFPGLMITFTAVALVLISNYLRARSDPLQASVLRASYRRVNIGAGRRRSQP